jgi:hypothetical protein
MLSIAVAQKILIPWCQVPTEHAVVCKPKCLPMGRAPKESKQATIQSNQVAKTKNAEQR